MEPSSRRTDGALPDGAAISGVMVVEHPAQVGVEITRPSLLVLVHERGILRTGTIKDEARDRANLVGILEEGSNVVRSGAPVEKNGG